MKDILPQIDNEQLQNKANEYAQKGAEDTIREFYTGYNSPFKEAIKKDLENKGFKWPIELPDVIANINEALTKQIDVIANEAIAKSFVPMVTKFLTRAEPEMKFSKILHEFIECTNFEYNDASIEDYTVEIEKEERGFIRLTITDGADVYELGLSDAHKYSNDPEKRDNPMYTIYSLPFTYRPQIERSMVLSVDDKVKLEIPFTKGILENKFAAFTARLVMAETKIDMDVRDFDEEMFPQRCHC